MKSLQVSSIHEEKVKDSLKKSILNKQKILSQWAGKVEMLRLDLDIVKHEYDVRIGRLLLKDNQLDLEIIQYRNLKALMEEGLTYEEAIKHEEGMFYQELLQQQRQKETIDEEEEFLESRNKVDENTKEEIKKVWKKLIFKFHPDLVADSVEKKEREEIMKKINTAYAQNDLEMLLALENNIHIENHLESSVDRLEKILVDIENNIRDLQVEFQELRASQWSGWKKRKEKAKSKEDIFMELEKDILDDIARKIQILRKLRKEVNLHYAYE